MAKRKLSVMVSSSVYGFEDQLQQIEAILSGYQYRVIISHRGTLRVAPHQHNFDACQRAVEECDIFLGIIRGRYGSGQGAHTGLNDGAISITHLEVRHAIRAQKPRLFLVESRVDTARQLLKHLRPHLVKDLFDPLQQPVWKAAGNPFKNNPVLDDLRVLDMYDEALQTETPLSERRDHWCQTYHSFADIQRFLEAQFQDRRRLEADLRTGVATKYVPGGS